MSPSLISDHPEPVAPPAKTAGIVPFAGTPAPASSSSSKKFGNMNTSLVESKFLSHPEELGVVAVGFSGGQVGSASATRSRT